MFALTVYSSKCVSVFFPSDISYQASDEMSLNMILQSLPGNHFKDLMGFLGARTMYIHTHNQAWQASKHTCFFSSWCLAQAEAWFFSKHTYCLLVTLIVNSSIVCFRTQCLRSKTIDKFTSLLIDNMFTERSGFRLLPASHSSPTLLCHQKGKRTFLFLLLWK